MTDERQALIGRAGEALDVLHRYSFGDDEFERSQLSWYVERVSDTLKTLGASLLPFEYRVVSKEGEQSGPITFLEDAESGRYSTGHDGDFIQYRQVRGPWIRLEQ